MAARECKCGDPVGHAKAVSSAVFGCLSNAGNEPEREDYWRTHAELLERKFTTGHGKHCSLYLE